MSRHDRRSSMRLERLEERYALNAAPVLLTHSGEADGVGALGNAGAVSLNSKIIFSASRSVVSGASRLWSTDGTASGTQSIANLDARIHGSEIRELTRFGDQVFFAFDDATYGDELWVTDGTANGTRLAADIWAGGQPSYYESWLPNHSSPEYLTATENGLFFVANPGDGDQLFKYTSDDQIPSPVLYSDGSEIKTFRSNFGSTDAAMLSNDRYMYLFVASPVPPTGGGSGGPSYDWIRYDTLTGETLQVTNNHPDEGIYNVAARGLISDGICFQSGSAIYVLQHNELTPRRLFSLAEGKAVHRIVEDRDWIYAELRKQGGIIDPFEYPSDEVIRFHRNGNSFETVWKVVAREGSEPNDVVVRGIQILGPTAHGLMFSESVTTTSTNVDTASQGASVVGAAYFNGVTRSTIRTDIVRVQNPAGEILDVGTFGPYSSSSLGLKYSSTEGPYATSWETSDKIPGAIFFEVDAPEEVAGQSARVRKLFFSYGSEAETFEMVSRLNRGGGLIGGLNWGDRIYLVGNDLLFTDEFYVTPDNPMSDSGLRGGIFIQQVELNGNPSIDPIEESLISQDATDKLIMLTGIGAGASRSGVIRVTAYSSNPGLVPDPTVTYSSPNSTGVISFRPVSGRHGEATITVTVEDSGLDGALSTPDDNTSTTQSFRVTVLETINDGGRTRLNRNASGHLYVNTHPISHNGQNIGQSFFGFDVVRAEAISPSNMLFVRRAGTNYRLFADDAWQISGIFDAIRNETATPLNPAARQPVEFALTAIPGAYVIDSLTNPTLTVHRGQKVTFDLNVNGHPFYLQTTGSGYVEAKVYSEGFTGNGETTGRFEWVVPDDAPDELFYQCGFHPVMFGKIIVVD